MVDSIVVCNACGREIRFPTATPSRRVMNQMSSAPIEIPRNILCPHCKHVLLYEAPEFYPSGVENTDSPPRGLGPSMHSREMCSGRLRISRPTAFDNAGVEQHEERGCRNTFQFYFCEGEVRKRALAKSLEPG